MAVIPPEQLQSIARRRLGLQETARGGQQRLLQDYGTDTQRLGQANTEAVQGVNDTLAGQGLFNSGIRITEQGKVARTYGQQLADLEQGKSRGLEDISGALTSGLAGLNEEEARALADATREEQQRRLEQERWQAEQAARLRPPTPPQFVQNWMAQNQQPRFSQAELDAIGRQMFPAPQPQPVDQGLVDWLGAHNQTLAPATDTTRQAQQAGQYLDAVWGSGLQLPPQPARPVRPASVGWRGFSGRSNFGRGRR